MVEEEVHGKINLYNDHEIRCLTHIINIKDSLLPIYLIISGVVALVGHQGAVVVEEVAEVVVVR